MKLFEPHDDGRWSERIEFLKRLFEALVGEDASGPAASVHGQLVYANACLMRAYVDGFGANCDEPGQRLAGTELGAMADFLIETLVANRGEVLSVSDVAYLGGISAALEAEWLRGARLCELLDRAEDVGISAVERDELEELNAHPGLDLEDFFTRTECWVANWCIVNDALVDRRGNPVVVGGVSAVSDIFAEPVPCSLCGESHARQAMPCSRSLL